MRTVKVNKLEFIERVTVNRDAHRRIFKRALKGYERRLLSELEQRIDDVSAGRQIDRYIGLPEPADHTADYDRILGMAEMSVDDVIELDANDFARFVMDQWDWKQDFIDTASLYEGVR